MSFVVERAFLTHIQTIINLHMLVWSNELIIPDQFQLCLNQPTHCVHMACVEDNSQIVGYISGFMTRTAQDQKRWEVDLLAVHPDYRGRGIAQALVRSSVQAGKGQGAAFSRALTQVDNYAVHSTFGRVGFTTGRVISELLVSHGNRQPKSAPQSEAYLIPVETLTYRGVWVENDYSEAALQAGQIETSRCGCDVTGVVIPTENTVEIAAASRLGYETGGQYIWWKLP